VELEEGLSNSKK